MNGRAYKNFGRWSVGYYTSLDRAFGYTVDAWGLIVQLYKLRLFLWWR